MSKLFKDCKRRHIVLDYFSHNWPGERARELLKPSTYWESLASFDCRISLRKVWKRLFFAKRKPQSIITTALQ